jgi:hypothetical protein
MADFAACLKLYHGLDLLVQHGMRPFYVFFNKVTLIPSPSLLSSNSPNPFLLHGGLYVVTLLFCCDTERQTNAGNNIGKTELTVV